MPQDIYDKIMMIAKRRGFIYPSFEIYGGIAGFYDYGPLGSQLKNNVENLWRRFYVLQDNCIEITTPTITLYEVLKASGHVEEFTDLTVDCTRCKRSYKVEDIIEKGTSVEQAVKEKKLICPNCKAPLHDAHPVNLMFSTTIGIGEGRKAFLRPETAQGIFTNTAGKNYPSGSSRLEKDIEMKSHPGKGRYVSVSFPWLKQRCFSTRWTKHTRILNLLKTKNFIFLIIKKNGRSLLLRPSQKK